jgi:hypothetical protein
MQAINKREQNMQLSNGTNSIDDRRYAIALDAMQHLHWEELDFRSNLIAQGRSEYSIDDLHRQHDAERSELAEQRRVLSVAQWLTLHPHTR